MKIGILTFHRAHNYGAFLQCYALQKYLTKLGHDVKVIDYYPMYFHKGYSAFNLFDISSLSFIKKIKRLLGTLIIYVPKKIRSSIFDKAIMKDLSLTKLVENSEQDFFNDFDVIFFGSDQIWCPKITNGFDNFYWGQFPFKGKKIAYAASAGDDLKDLEENYTNVYNYLTSFYNISVREKELQTYIESRYGIKSSLVLDPTLLLNSSQWNEYVKSIKKNRRKYLLLYIVKTSDTAFSIAKKIAMEKNYKLITLYAGITKNIRTWRGCSYTPKKFVSLFRDAEYVITTSFHGTAFAINFNKPFYTIKVGNKNSRIESLLEIYNLQDRYVSTFEDIKLENQQKIEPSNLSYNSEDFINKSLGV